MGAQNFDIDFEDYIIFHCGVQEVSFDPNDNHLRVTDQDGSVQDLGDPLGDRVDKAEAAGEYAAQIEAMIRAEESEIENKLNSATLLSTDANIKYEQTIEIGDEVREAKAYVDGRIGQMLDGSVDGIEKDEETGKYFVDLTNYSTTSGVESLVDAGILKIDGVEAYEQAGVEAYYLNPVKGSSKTTEAINDMINNRFEDVNGITYDASKNEYVVDLSDDAITTEEIQSLFA